MSTLPFSDIVVQVELTPLTCSRSGQAENQILLAIGIGSGVWAASPPWDLGGGLGKGKTVLSALVSLELPEPMLPTTEQVCLKMMPTQGKKDREEERGRTRTALFGLLDPAVSPLIHEPIHSSYGFNCLRRFLSHTT